MQTFADEIGLPVSVCHFPPGTSKWNKIEHRLFSFISSNWRGEPLRDYETVVKLISRTTTAKGLTDPFFFISSQGFFSKGYKSTILPPKAPALVSYEIKYLKRLLLSNQLIHSLNLTSIARQSHD